MTIRELHEATNKDIEILISTENGYINIPRNNPFVLDVFGDYIIGYIVFEEKHIYIDLKTTPIKKG